MSLKYEPVSVEVESCTDLSRGLPLALSQRLRVQEDRDNELCISYIAPLGSATRGVMVKVEGLDVGG